MIPFYDYLQALCLLGNRMARGDYDYAQLFGILADSYV